jgi:hypothetical protein
VAAPATFNATPVADLSLPSGLGCADLWGEEDRLAVALQDGGVAWVDIAAPQPQLLDTWNPGDLLAQGVHVVDSWIAVANASYNGVAIYLLQADGSDGLMERARVEVPMGQEACHDLWFDRRGYLYCAVESFITGPQVRIYDLRDPFAGIVQVGAFEHPGGFGLESEEVAIRQLMVQDQILYMAWGAGGVIRASIADPAQPQQIGAVLRHAGERTGGVWPTADGVHLLACDEMPGGWVRVWDLTTPGAEEEVATFSAEGAAIPHRVRIKGDLAYLAYYEAGTRVLDIVQPASPVEVAFHDPFPAPVEGRFGGTWGVWPFQSEDNSPGTHEEIYLTDTAGQLFVVGLDGPRRARLHGHLQWSDGASVPLARLQARESGHAARSDALGDYVLDTGAATQTIDVSGFAIVDTSMAVSLLPGDDLERNLVIAEAPDPDVVLVDADGGEERQVPIESWFAELGLERQTWDVATCGLLQPGRLSAFATPAVIVWNTGAVADVPLSAAARETLDVLLAKGHPLLLAGQYIGDAPGASEEWLATRCGAEHVADQINMPYLQGPEGDPVTGGMFLALDTSDSEWGQKSAGQVATIGAASPLLYYSGTAFAAGVRQIGSDAATAYLEFGLEGLQESGGLTAPSDFLQALLAWLEAPTAIEGGDSQTPAMLRSRSTLGTIAPNPFNPRVMIEFDISLNAAEAPVDLAVYALDGRLVRTLFSGRMLGGKHTVSWDGCSRSGRPVASGCYFCRLATRDGTERRSMLLLK